LNPRLSWYRRKIYYDLCNESWEAVEIDEDGWRIVPAPVIFRRFKHQKAQIKPSEDGSIEDLLPFFEGIKREDFRFLVTVLLVTYFIPNISHPILVPHGSQGSGKTSLVKFIKALVDPSLAETLGHIKRDDLILYLHHHWISCIDNQSFIKQDVQDILSRTVTGDAHSKRMLYTNGEDFIMRYQRCIILSGINVVATSPDLLDRCILAELERFSRTGKIKTDDELHNEFKDVRSSILGGIFNVLSKAMAEKRGLKQLKHMTRMADFEVWGAAINKVLTGIAGKDYDFREIYYKNINTQNLEVIESHSVAQAVINFMENRKDWNGTASDLLEQLNKKNEEAKKDRSWPKNAQSLARKLNTLEHNLKEVGVEMTRQHEGNTRMLTIINKN